MITIENVQHNIQDVEKNDVQFGLKQSILVKKCIIFCIFLDHLNSALYTFLIPILSPIFIFASDKIVGDIIAYSTLASSIVARPIGAYFFGSIVKKYGAYTVLAYSILGSSASFGVLGLLPSHESVGYYSTIFLFLLSIIQGVYSSGLRSIGALYVLKSHSKQAERKSAYFCETAKIAAIVCASFIGTYILKKHEIYENLWKHTFFFFSTCGLFAFIVCIIIYNKHKIKITHDIDDTAFKINILFKRWREIAKVVSIANYVNITYFLPIVVMNQLMPLMLNVTVIDMMSINNFLLIFDMILIPLIGHRVINLSVKSVLKVAIYAIFISILPLWYFLPYFGIGYIIFIRLWIVFFGVLATSVFSVWANYEIKSNDKYIIFGVGYAISIGVFSKTLPSISLLIFHQTHNYLLVAAYILLLLLPGFLIMTPFFKRS